MVPTYATSWNWFVCIFSRESWYREVEGSFLSPFHDHFVFYKYTFFVYFSSKNLYVSPIEKTKKRTCTRTRNFFTENKNGHETDLEMSFWHIDDTNLHKKTLRIQPE